MCVCVCARTEQASRLIRTAGTNNNLIIFIVFAIH